MNPPPERPAPGRDSDAKPPRKSKVRTRTPRPDELSCEAFEFISAIDEYKRKHMRSFLGDEEILEIILSLGYVLGGADEAVDSVTRAEVEAFVAVREKYRSEQGRLFPTWSEVFQLLVDLGYRRVKDSAA